MMLNRDEVEYPGRGGLWQHGSRLISPHATSSGILLMRTTISARPCIRVLRSCSTYCIPTCQPTQEGRGGEGGCNMCCHYHYVSQPVPSSLPSIHPSEVLVDEEEEAEYVSEGAISQMTLMMRIRTRGTKKN